MNLENSTPKEFWKYIASHLRSMGIEVVLCGGFTAVYYTSGQVDSGDIDFVTNNLFTEGIAEAMTSLGFEFKSGCWRRDDSPWNVEVFREIVEIAGESTGISIENIDLGDGEMFQILSPLDAIKQRMANYIFFDSGDTLLDSAILLKEQISRIDINKLKSWCDNQAKDGEDPFQELLDLYNKM